VDWYGPEDTWPRHNESSFRDALSYARSSGWWFGEFSSHSFGKVVCSCELPSDARCELLIFSSGKDAESVAFELHKMVDRCPHKTRPETRKTAVQVARELLNEADTLIQAAERCMAADGMKDAADELLELAAAATDGATEALSGPEVDLDRALDLEAAAREERHVATSLADSAGYPDQEPVQPEPLLSAADERVTTAERRLGPPSNTGRERSEMRRRAGRIRAQIQSARDQLGS
jgi:hypothetical protein